jgi:glycosyltransferase involved in cell wall biosynthesis
LAGVIVQEWLAEHGGSENVTEEVARLFPDAPIACLWNDNPQRFPADRVSESWLARTPLRRNKSLALPFMPSTWRHLGRSDAEWIFCSSHLFAHHARFSGPARDAPKYVYAHTPARYIWNAELDERGNSLPARLASVGLKPLDRHRAAEAKAIAANSEFVRARVKAAWRRDSTVIYPPVDVADFLPGSSATPTDEEAERISRLPSEFVLGASRLIPYKRLDLVIKAGEAAGLPVVIAGIGPSESALRELARDAEVEVHFFGRPSRGGLKTLFASAIAYVFPAVEDFGIMPVEAMAAGAPVIGLTMGGVAETVEDGVSGALVENFSADEVREAIGRVNSISRNACVARAELFDRAVFDDQITEWIGSD